FRGQIELAQRQRAGDAIFLGLRALKYEWLQVRPRSIDGSSPTSRAAADDHDMLWHSNVLLDRPPGMKFQDRSNSKGTFARRKRRGTCDKPRNNLTSAATSLIRMHAAERGHQLMGHNRREPRMNDLAALSILLGAGCKRR